VLRWGLVDELIAKVASAKAGNFVGLVFEAVFDSKRLFTGFAVHAAGDSGSFDSILFLFAFFAKKFALWQPGTAASHAFLVECGFHSSTPFSKSDFGCSGKTILPS